LKKSILLIALTYFCILPNFASAEDKGWVIGKPENGYYEILISLNPRLKTKSIKDLFLDKGAQRLTTLFTFINTNDSPITKVKLLSNNARLVGISKEHREKWIVHVPKNESKLIDLALNLHEVLIDHTRAMENLDKTSIEELRGLGTAKTNKNWLIEKKYIKDEGWIIGEPEKGYYEIRFSPDFRSNTYTLEELFESHGGQRLAILYTAVKIKNSNRDHIRLISNNARFVGVAKGQWIVHVPKYESELIDFALSIYELDLDYNGLRLRIV